MYGQPPVVAMHGWAGCFGRSNSVFDEVLRMAKEIEARRP